MKTESFLKYLCVPLGIFNFIPVIIYNDMIIGIGGVSRSGKSLLAKQIAGWYPGDSVKILDQDDYVYPVEKIPKIKGETDWECPESINFDRYLTVVQQNAQIFDRVIAEGLMVFYDPRLVALMDKKIFLTIPYELFVQRKKPDTRWGPFPDWYIDHIWNSYLKYGMPAKGDTNLLIVSGSEPFSKKMIDDYLRSDRYNG